LANLIIYAFTINQVPHVFREYYFAGHKHKYMGDFTERRLFNADLRKRIRETPTKSFQNKQGTLDTDPCPAQGLPRKGGGEAAWSWTGWS
jgi:hypothetical protein